MIYECFRIYNAASRNFRLSLSYTLFFCTKIVKYHFKLLVYSTVLNFVLLQRKLSVSDRSLYNDSFFG
jgi:hypothetical protein